MCGGPRGLWAVRAGVEGDPCAPRSLTRRNLLALLLPAGLTFSLARAEAPAVPLKLGTFDVDATPSRGGALAYDSMREAGELTLRCRGIVLTGMEKPVVLCAVDWIGIANGAHAAFCESLAGSGGYHAGPRGRACVAPARCAAG